MPINPDADVTPPPAAPVKLERGTLFSLVTIDVRHGFANGGNGVFTRLAVRPTPETSRRLALFGMIARSRPDGIDIVWDSAHRDAASVLLDGLRPLVGGLAPDKRQTAIDAVGALWGEPLLFSVALDDPRFANFTDMPIDLRIGEPPLLLSNLALTAIAGRQADLVVPWPDDPSAVPSEPPEQKATVGEGYYAALAKAQAAASQAAAAFGSPPAAAPAPPAPSPASPLDSLKKQARLNAGYDAAARAERAGLSCGSRYFALLELHFVRDPAAPAPSGSGWNGLPIDLGRGLFDPASTDDWRYFTPCSYTLRFAPRATRWRYLVAARHGTLDPASLAIVDPDGADAPFVLAEQPSILPDGRPAACLASRDALPIVAQPTLAFSLLGNPPAGPARRRTLVERLPAAGAERLSLGLDGEPPPPRSGQPPPLYSDIYVFV